jgi:hypothetical protein
MNEGALHCLIILNRRRREPHTGTLVVLQQAPASSFAKIATSPRTHVLGRVRGVLRFSRIPQSQWFTYHRKVLISRNDPRARAGSSQFVHDSRACLSTYTCHVGTATYSGTVWCSENVPCLRDRASRVRFWPFVFRRVLLRVVVSRWDRLGCSALHRLGSVLGVVVFLASSNNLENELARFHGPAHSGDPAQRVRHVAQQQWRSAICTWCCPALLPSIGGCLSC